MIKHSNSIISIAIRYICLVLLAIGNLWIIYTVLTPLTIRISYLFIKLIFEDAILFKSTVIYSAHSLQIISSCVAGSAYFLLLILNLSTPMDARKRTKSLVFLIASFFLINILRIFVFAILFANDYSSLDVLHKITWYALGSLFVVMLWFANIRMFNITSIPIYSDISFLMQKRKDIKS